jgi:hypothetical protein
MFILHFSHLHFTSEFVPFDLSSCNFIPNHKSLKEKDRLLIIEQRRNVWLSIGSKK